MANIQKLKMAQDLMREVERKRLPLNMSTWGRQDDEHPCGTAACLGGWCAMSPKFQALGLRAEVDGGDYGEFVPFTPGVPLVNEDWDRLRIKYVDPKTGEDLGRGLVEYTLARFFEITERQADYLFTNWEDGNSTQERIDRIQEVIDGTY